MGTPKDSEKTKARIIEAAGALFAEKGFKKVTVREIVKAARTHLGALNYHFQSKDSLYHTVLLKACELTTFSTDEVDQLKRLSSREALYLMIVESIRYYKLQGEDTWAYKLLSRECREPSKTFDELAKVYFTPHADYMAEMIAKVVEKPADDFQVRFATVSLFGLLETFGAYDHLTEAMAPGLLNILKKKNLLAKQLLKIITDIAAQPSEKSILNNNPVEVSISHSA